MNSCAISREGWGRLGQAVTVVLLLALILAPQARAQENLRTVEGEITYIAENAVEVAGVRGLIGPRSSILSSGREITVRSIRRGMPARMELDAAGRVLELRVAGVVE
jgi:hypothetical protein